MKQIRPEGAYIKDIFERVNLQQIREFLLYGSESLEIAEKGYDERLKEGSDPIYNRIDKQYANDNVERDSIASDVSHALATHDAVYLEIGMKVGAKLIYQLLLTDSVCPETETIKPD